MALDRDTTQKAFKFMEALLRKYCVMDWSAPVRVPDYAGFKLSIFEGSGFPYPPVYLPFAMVACELQCEAIIKKDQDTGKASDEGFAAFMQRKLLFSIEEMLSSDVQKLLAELRSPENMRLGEKQADVQATSANDVDDLPKALTILNDRLRRFSSGAEPDSPGFLREARSWTDDAYGSAFALGTAIALTEMQCESMIRSVSDDADARSKATHARMRLELLQCLRKELSSEINQYVDAAKAKLPEAVATQMPWH